MDEKLPASSNVRQTSPDETGRAGGSFPLRDGSDRPNAQHFADTQMCVGAYRSSPPPYTAPRDFLEDRRLLLSCSPVEWMYPNVGGPGRMS